MPAPVVELLDRPDQAQVSLLDQILKRDPHVPVVLGDGDHQLQVVLHELVLVVHQPVVGQVHTVHQLDEQRGLHADGQLHLANLLAQHPHLALALGLALLRAGRPLGRPEARHLSLVADHRVAGRAQLAAHTLYDLHGEIGLLECALDAVGELLRLLARCALLRHRGDLVVLCELRLDLADRLVESRAALFPVGRAGAVGLRHLRGHSVLRLQTAPDVHGLPPGERHRQDAGAHLEGGRLHLLGEHHLFLFREGRDARDVVEVGEQRVAIARRLLVGIHIGVFRIYHRRICPASCAHSLKSVSSPSEGSRPKRDAEKVASPNRSLPCGSARPPPQRSSRSMPCPHKVCFKVMHPSSAIEPPGVVHTTRCVSFEMQRRAHLH